MKAIVINENTLGILIKRDIYQILRASILKGATSNANEGWQFIFRLDKVRQATTQDFKNFRVDYHEDYEIA